MPLTLEQMQKEEKELEGRLFSTPEETRDQETSAASDSREQTVAPTDDNEAVTSDSQPAKDEHDEAQRGEDWEKRYKNLRNARDEKLHDAKLQLANAIDTIQKLQQDNDKLRDEVETLRANTDPFADLFSQEETDVLGDNTVDVIKKASKRAADAATKDLKEQLAQEKAERTKQQAKQSQNEKAQAYDIFIARLARMVPDWEILNTSPEFVKFCHENSDIDGSLIADNFRNAEARGDATTIARYMLQFKSLVKPKDDNPLAERVGPKGSASGTPTKEAAPVIVTQAEIHKFYDDLARGLYKGKRKLADELEAKYDLAVMEGRVR